jgi:hypothetical protein
LPERINKKKSKTTIHKPKKKLNEMKKKEKLEKKEPPFKRYTRMNIKMKIE